MSVANGFLDPLLRYYDVHYEVLLLMSIPTLRNYGLTNRALYTTVKNHLHFLLNIDRLYSPFIPVSHIPRFRGLQQKTGAIVGGSLALQFFTGTRFAQSDMDIYVYFERAIALCSGLMKMGARLQDTASVLQPLGEDVPDNEAINSVTFGKIFSGIFDAFERITDENASSHDYSFLSSTYLSHGILTVFNFVSQGRKLQVIVTTIDPVHIISMYHSSQ
ncbi:hypothetical protein ONZ45_g10771 [Pleurotus djamor]|nr:hypothetical protein ONZ45_g10771 [Pleurotus djamor]